MQGYKFLAIISSLLNAAGSELKKETAMDITGMMQSNRSPQTPR